MPLKSKKIADISIVAANYNNGGYLFDFIDSIINSTVLPKEIIIVDDGSTDDSLKILEKYSDVEGLKVLKFKKNRGLCHALNYGLDNATGKYILRVDPDDILINNRIEIQFNYLEKNSDIDVLGSNAVYFSSQTKKVRLMTNFPTTHRKIRETYQKGEHGVLQGTTMIRGSILKEIRYRQEYVKLEDYDFFSRIIIKGHRFASLKSPLLFVRVHDNSLSNNISRDTITKVFKLRDELFNTSTTIVKELLYFWYIFNYRRFLITENIILKYSFLFLSVLSHPGKLIKKINYLIHSKRMVKDLPEYL